LTPLLAASDIEIRYEGSPRAAVIGASLELEAGAALGIVGESGSGKTTLARALVGALEPTEGEVTVSGRRWASIPRKDPARRMVQMVFQDPYASLNPSLTARETVAEVFRVWERFSKRETEQRAEALLAEVGLVGNAVNSKPPQLSGGQRQRVGIARALACEPAILVADEPTSSLDVSVQAQILNLLADLRERRHLALILVSHDLSVVRHMTERAMVMYGGRIVEHAPTEQLFEAPSHPYTRVLIDSAPEQSGQARLVVNDTVPRDHGGCVFARRCVLVQADCLAQQPPLAGDARHQVSCFHPLSAPETTVDLVEEAER
jgi:oligopeptide/dipeptide ABC transporter ATP-binding protein